MSKLGIGLAVLITLVIIGFVLQQTADHPFRATPKLDASIYLDNANSLRSNRYRFTGIIENSLAWSPSGGRLFSVTLQEPDSTLPILVPSEMSHLNIQKGQRFDFKVEVQARGVLVVQQLQKP